MIRTTGRGLLCGLALAACVGTIGEAPPDLEAAGDPPPEQPQMPLHRLNRLEYDNTVRDLLGTGLQPAQAFPPDGESAGFDNIAEALQLTPTLLDQYYTAARTVVDDALDDVPAFGAQFGRDAFTTPAGYAVGSLWALSGAPITVTFEAPGQDLYFVYIRLGASQIGAAPAPQWQLELDGVPVETYPIPGTAAALATHTHALQLEMGSHTLRFIPTNYVNEPVANNANNILVASIEVASETEQPGPGRERVFICEPDDSDGCPTEILHAFARRAWRRPLSAEEEVALGSLYTQLTTDGETTEAAIRLGLRAIMVSPKFLYRARTLDDDERDGRLDPFTLASRLSYFLWSSTPDQRLYDAANAGELSTPEGLEAAVGWMLADEKAAGLRDGFAEQWLALRLLEQASPSPEVYPDFDDAVRDSMKAASKQFFADFVSGDQPVANMLDPDFAYLDDRLARHYGLDPVGSETMTRIDDAPRRGLLSLGGWLTAASHAEHSSPIKRGLWVSDAILCEPVPPPPPGLAIEPIVLGDDGTVREALERHRDDPTCASCHALLDVLGMGFERFDGTGRMRPEADLDARGELPDGTTFEGAVALAELIEREAFVGCLTQKLFTYGLGRTVEGFDAPIIEDIASRATKEGFSLADLLVAIVTSPSFRMAPPRTEGDRP